MILLKKIILVAFLAQWLAFGAWQFRRSDYAGDYAWAVIGGFLSAGIIVGGVVNLIVGA